MVESTFYFLNRLAAVIAAGLVNTAILTVSSVALAVFVSRHKGWSAATRYCLWWLTMAFVILAPLTSVLLPASQVSPVRFAEASAPITNQLALMDKPLVVAKTERAVPLARQTPKQTYIRTFGPALLLLCWLLASVARGLRVWRSFIYGFSLKRTSAPAGEAIACMFRRLAAASGIWRPVELSLSTKISAPAAVGYLRPRVFLPADLSARLSAAEIEQILLHELAHVARYDDWSIAAQRVIEAAGVWHPLVRFLGRQIEREREMACDDCVAAVHEPKRYAACLAKVAEVSQFTAASAVLVPLFSRKSELLARVEFLLDKSRTHTPRTSLQRLALASTAFLVLGLAGLRAPKLMATPPQEEAKPAVSSPTGVHRIAVTSGDGHTSTFGSWSVDPSVDDDHEPGTIEFRADRKTYVIRDKSVLAQAKQILKPIEELGQRQSQLGEKQAKLGEQQAKLGEEQRTIAERQLDAATKATLDQKLKELKAKMAELDSKQTGETASEAQEMIGELQSRLAEMQADMGSEEGKLSESQGRLGEQQAKLGEEQRTIAERQLDAATKATLDQKLKELKTKMAELDSKQTGETASEAQEMLGKLQSRLAEMQADMGSEEGKLGESQGRLGEQQGKLGAQQGELGRQQGKLGEQQAAESKRAEKKLEDLIRSARLRGLAQPLQ